MDGGPYRHGQAKIAPGSEKRQGAPCITSATIASALTVRGPSSGNKKQILEISWSRLDCRSDIAVKATHDDVTLPNIDEVLRHDSAAGAFGLKGSA